MMHMETKLLSSGDITTFDYQLKNKYLIQILKSFLQEIQVQKNQQMCELSIHFITGSHGANHVVTVDIPII